MVYPPFQVLAGDRVPERRAGSLARAKESHRLTRCVGIDMLVVRGRPLTGKPEKLGQQLGAEEASGSDPSIVEGVKQCAEVGPGQLGGHQRCSGLRAIALTA